MISIPGVRDNALIIYEDTTIEDVLKTFEAFYVKKDYSNALLTLQKNSAALPNGLLSYNFGVIYSKLENWPLARYHFLQAEEFGFSQVELIHGLELVETKLELAKLEVPINLTDHLIKVSLFAKDGVLTSLGLLALLLGLIVLKKKATLSKAVIWILGVIFPIALSFWIDSWPRMIVEKPEAISEGPSALFREIGELPPGLLVVVRGEGDWRKVIWPSRYSGWVRTNALLKLE